jgi:uncharacterized protein (DUF983 family)
MRWLQTSIRSDKSRQIGSKLLQIWVYWLIHRAMYIKSRLFRTSTMFCPVCGEEIKLKDARYCQACGHELDPVNQGHRKLPAEALAPGRQGARSPGSPVARLYGVFIVILIVGLISGFAAMLIPAFEGIRPSGNQVAWTEILASLLFYVLFRRSGNRGWQGATLGFVIGFLLLVAVNVIVEAKQGPHSGSPDKQPTAMPRAP